MRYLTIARMLPRQLRRLVRDQRGISAVEVTPQQKYNDSAQDIEAERNRARGARTANADKERTDQWQQDQDCDQTSHA